MISFMFYLLFPFFFFVDWERIMARNKKPQKNLKSNISWYSRSTQCQKTKNNWSPNASHTVRQRYENRSFCSLLIPSCFPSFLCPELIHFFINTDLFSFKLISTVFNSLSVVFCSETLQRWDEDRIHNDRTKMPLKVYLRPTEYHDRIWRRVFNDSTNIFSNEGFFLAGWERIIIRNKKPQTKFKFQV